MQPSQVRNTSVNLYNNLLCALQDLWCRSYTRTKDNMSLFGDSGGFDDGPIQWFLGVSVFLVERVVAVDKVLGEHGEMLVGKVDAACVDPLGDFLADLVGVPSCDPGSQRVVSGVRGEGVGGG